MQSLTDSDQELNTQDEQKNMCHDILSNSLPKRPSHLEGLEHPRRMLGKCLTQGHHEDEPRSHKVFHVVQSPVGHCFTTKRESFRGRRATKFFFSKHHHIDWAYFFKAFRRLGFNLLWMKWVVSFYEEISFSIKINNYLASCFSLSCLVC
jgi:hypothetical protein